METITTSATTIKTPEAENETPTRIHQAIKPPSFSNGVLKRHHPLHPHPHHHHHNHHHAVVVTYKECLKNHAAAMGGHAVDGCGEFMPSPNVNPSDPTSLKCAACGCHRNFHRRDNDPFPSPSATPILEYQPHHRHHPPPPPPLNTTTTGSHSSPSSPSPPPISSSYYHHPSAPHMLITLNSPGSNNPSSRKRFRTRFTPTQKEKMLQFADRIEWKIQKRDEDIINEFCNEVGVEKGVLKVWMHNNKNTLGKKDENSNIALAIATTTTITTTPNSPTQLNNGNGVAEGGGGGGGGGAESSAGSYNNRDGDVVATTTTTNGSAASS